MIGQYFPIFFVGPIMGRFGKRVSLMIDSVLFSIGFILMAFSVNVMMLYAAKFLFGTLVCMYNLLVPYKVYKTIIVAL